MTDHRHNDFTLIFAKKEAGKSHLARHLAEAYPRRIILDPMFESTRGVKVRNASDAIDYLRAVKDGPQFSVILRTMDPADELAVIRLCMYGEPDSPLLPGTLLYIDEMDRLCTPTSIPDEMKRLANYGRHFGISLIGVARSPKAVHRDFTRNANHIYIGRLLEPLDVDYLRDYTGSDFCERAKTMQERQFICWPDDLPPISAVANDADNRPIRSPAEPIGGQPAGPTGPAEAGSPNVAPSSGASDGPAVSI